MNTPITRREAIRRALCGAAGLWLADNLAFRLWAATPAAKMTGKAKSVIQIWMWGGPSHLDTFDPKPEAGTEYSGPLKAIETNVAGIRICELMPLLAKQADKYSIIRSLTHGNNGHETASYIVQTGRKAGEREVYPCVGAVVSLFKGYDGGYKGQIPPYVVLTEPQGRFSEAGFLGSKYKPFATGGDPSQARFIVEGIVAPGITDERQRARRELLGKLNTFSHALPQHPAMRAMAQSEDQAYEMILGAGAKVFDLSTEDNELRDRYGRNKFGQSCLMARRLVEQAVPYITINYPGWDTHKDNFQTMRRKLPELDKGMATLIQDLSERGLLDRTILWWGGEFGRTPKVDWQAPWNGGRGHWGKVFSAVVAGGGFKGGQLVGASDARGEEVKDRPVYPRDLIGTMYQLMGIDRNAKLPHPQGLDARVTPAADENIPGGGLLEEIV
jgi:hypothetical protein